MTGLIAKAALGALAAEEADVDAEYNAYVGDALRLALSSPLGGLFPGLPLGWKVVEHNLPDSLRDGYTTLVVVTPDREQCDEPELDLHFVVLKQSGSSSMELYVADPAVAAKHRRLGVAGWTEGNPQRVRKLSDVGRAIRMFRSALDKPKTYPRIIV